MNAVRPLLIFAGLLMAWQALVSLSGLPPYILPDPVSVFAAWSARPGLFIEHGAITAAEIVMGLGFGFILGISSALVLAYFRPARAWLLPLLVVSQALPVFALAPILVLWFGYGMGSKVVMATLIIYFPVTAAFYDGLRRTETDWLDLARTMDGGRWALLRHVRVPAALPALGSGLRVATAVAPIGAIVGEWVGSSGGLGYLMLHANARMQIDVMFAALFTLAVLAVVLYATIDRAVRRLVAWQPESNPSEI